MSEKNNSKLKCGLIMPISSIDGCTAEHWEEVRLIIRESLAESNFQVELVSDSNEVGIIQNRIVNNIYNSDIVICDVSGKNPNVMFELGMRLAFDRPTVIIKDNKTNYSFDTAPIEHIEYPRDLHYLSVLDFKKTLNKKVLATHSASENPKYTTFLKHFGEFKIANVSEKEVSSEQYILTAIDDLRASMSRLERNTFRKKPTPVISKIKMKEVAHAFTSVFDEFRETNNISEFELYEHRVELAPLVINELINYGVDERLAGDIVSNEIEGQIKDQEPF